MPISIKSFELAYQSYKLFDVKFFGETIKTLVTHTPCIIDTWISDIENLHQRRLHRLTVGLDIEWAPSYNARIEYPPATLQLCVGSNCIIIQLLYLPINRWPQSLFSFLNNRNYLFVGFEIHGDKEKLYTHYGIRVGHTADLRDLAANRLGQEWFKTAEMRTLVKEVLRKEIQKPMWVKFSDWDCMVLGCHQILYACIDAYVSFEIGRRLSA